MNLMPSKRWHHDLAAILVMLSVCGRKTVNARDFKFSGEAREKMLRGINTLAGAVRVTLGPKGRNVALDKSFGPRITKDGVTVAKEIELADRFENMGAQMVNEIASKTS